MSWAVEEWKDGLPARALQKITEMEAQLEKLRKDQRQRQLHMDTVEAACEKQKQKVEEAKSEISALKRENQSLMDACDSLQAARQKLSHELQQRETQANCLEGQLTSARLHTDKIEQELKRCKNELECRSSVSSSELQSFSTPHHKGANNSTIYPETRERNTSDDKFEQLYEKYSTEVAERKNLENELKVLQIKLVNQTQAATSTSRLAIGRQQASSSIFPWQKQNTTTPARCGLFTGDTPLKRTSTSSVFPWENEPVSAAKRCCTTLSSLEVVPPKPGSIAVPVADKQLVGASAAARDGGAAFGRERCGMPTYNLADESIPSRSQERELEQRVHHQEMELESYASKLNVAMGQLDSARTELAEKEQSLVKSQNALSRLNIQHEQAVAKVTALEQKLKHVAEEMNCQRQNAESARLAAEQRLKDKEREQQEEVARLEHNINGLDQQLSQTKTKLGQELQHTKNEHNALQAEFDKALLQKQLQEKEVQELKQVLQKANDNVKLHQDMTKDAKCSLEEATKEKNNLSCNLEQSAHRVRKFEDDLKNLKQELHDSQRLQEDLQRKVVSQETEVENLKSKLEKQSKSLNGNMDNLKIIISDLEKKRDIALAVVKKNELEMEKMHFQLSASTTENKDLKNKLCHKASACSSLEDEKASLIQLKKEMSDNLNKLKLERDGLAGKVQDLEAQMEQTLSVPLEKQNTDVLEQENKTTKTQLCELKQALDNTCVKNTALKEKVWALQEELEESVKNQGAEMIELRKSSAQFSEKVAGLEHQLNFEKNANAELKEETAGLERQLTNSNNLMKSKEHIFESKEAELKVIKDALLKIVEELEKAHWALFEEKANTNEDFGPKMLDTPEQNLSTIEPFVRLMHYFTILGEHLSTLQSSLIAHKQTCSELEIKSESQLLEMSKAEAQTLEMSASYTKLQREFDKNTSKMEEDLNEWTTQLENIQKVLEEKNTNLNDISKQLEDTQANLVLQQERNTILQLDLEEAHHNLIMKSEQLEGYAIQSKESDSHLAKILEENVCMKEQAKAYEDFTSRQNQMTQHEEMIKELETTVNYLKSDLGNEIHSRESKCNQLQEDVRELQAQNVTLQQEKEQLLKLQDENEALINNLKSQLQQAEHYSLQTKKQASKAEKELANLQEQYMTSVEKQRKLEYMLSEQEKELASKILEIAQVKDNSHEALEQLMSAIKQLEESKCELVEKLKQAELQDNTNNNKIAYLMAEAESEVKQFNEEITMLNRRLSDVQDDNQALRLSNQNLEQKICENEKHLGSREEEMIARQNDYTKTFEQLNVIIGKQTAQLQQLEGENTKTKVTLHEKHQELEQLKVKLEECGFDFLKISGNLEMLQMDLEDKDVNLELYESQIKQLKDTIESLDNRLSENEDVDKVRQELEELRVHCDALSGQLLESQASAESLGYKVAEQEKLQSDLRVDVENAHYRENGLFEKLHCVQEQLESSLLEAGHLRTDVDNRNSDIAAKDKIICDLTKELQLSEDNIFKARNMYNDLQSESNALKEQLTKIQSHCILKQDAMIQLTGTNNNDEENAVNIPPTQHGLNICSLPSSEQNSSINIETELCQLKADYGVLSEKFRDLKTNYDALQKTCNLLSEKNTFALQEKILAGSLLTQALEDQEELKVEYNKGLLLQGQYEALQSCHNELQEKVQQTAEHVVELNSVIESLRSDKKNMAETLIRQSNNAQVECLALHKQVLGLQEKLKDTQEPMRQVLTKSECNMVQHLPHSLRDNIDTNNSDVESIHKRPKRDHDVENAHAEEMHEGYDFKKSIELDDQLNNVVELSVQLNIDNLQEESIQGTHSAKDITNETKVSEILESQTVLNSIKADECELSCNIDTLQEKNSVLLKQVSVFETNQNNLLSLEQDLDSVVSQSEHEQAKGSDLIVNLHSLELNRTLLVNKIQDLENEMQHIKSEKLDLEKQILSLEADAQDAYSKNASVEEMQHEQTLLALHKEEMVSVKAEHAQIATELHSLSNAHATLQNSYEIQNSQLSTMRLEKVEAAELICSLKAELLEFKERLQVSEEGFLRMLNEKEEICNKLKNLDNEALAKSLDYKEKMESIELLRNMKEFAEQRAETSQAKLECLQNEHSRVLESINSVLLEKAMLGKQLNSTEETIGELKRYIEKLKLILEADDRKRKEMEQKIRHSERKHDTLQDKIEQLKRELEMSEASLEDMVLRQEAIEEDAKIAVEEKNVATENYESCKAQLDLVSAEKQELVEEFKEKQHQVDEAKSTIMALRDTLQRQQEDNMNTRKAFEKHSSQVEVEMACHLDTAVHLQEQIKLLNEQLVSCKSELQKWQRQKDEWLSQCHAQKLACDIMQERAAAAESHVASLKNTRHALSVELQSVHQVLSELQAESNVALAELQDKQQTFVEELHKENGRRLAEKQVENHRALTVLHAQHDEQLLSIRVDYDSALSEMCAKHETLRAEMAAKHGEATMDNRALKLKLKTLQEAHQQLEVAACTLRIQHSAERVALEHQIKDLQEQISSQDRKIAMLKLAKEHDDTELKDAEKRKQELLDARVAEVEADKARLAKEKAALQGKLQLWMSNGRQLEKEKEELHKRIHKMEGKLKTLQGHGAGCRKALCDEGDQATVKRGRKGDVENRTEAKRMKPLPEGRRTAPREDTTYQPDGLPEVVSKGFADIPLVLEASPYVLCRTTMLSRRGGEDAAAAAASPSSPARKHPVTNLLQPRLLTRNTTTASTPMGKEQGKEQAKEQGKEQAKEQGKEQGKEQAKEQAKGSLPSAWSASPMTVITNSPSRTAPGCGASKPTSQRSLSRLSPEQREKRRQTQATSEAQLDDNCKMQ